MAANVDIPLTEPDTLKAWGDVFDATMLLEAGTKPDTIDQHFNKLRAETEAEITVKGVRVKNADEMIDEVERHHCDAYDKGIRQHASDLRAKIDALERGLDEQAREAGTLKPPKPSSASDGWLASIAHNLQRQEMRGLAQSWTRQQLVSHYETLSDKDAADMVAWIESEHAANYPTLKTTPDDSDVTAMMQMNTLLDARREARIPLHVKEVRLRIEASISGARRMLIRELTRTTARPAFNRRFNVQGTLRRSQRNHEATTAVY